MDYWLICLVWVKLFEDEDKVILLLKSLPAEYEDLATLLLRGKDKAEYDVVCALLC